MAREGRVFSTLAYNTTRGRPSTVAPNRSISEIVAMHHYGGSEAGDSSGDGCDDDIIINKFEIVLIIRKIQRDDGITIHQATTDRQTDSSGITATTTTVKDEFFLLYGYPANSFRLQKKMSFGTGIAYNIWSGGAVVSFARPFLPWDGMVPVVVLFSSGRVCGG